MSACYPAEAPFDRVPQKTVAEDWPKEAARYKWIVSEQAGHDLGETAIRRWVQDHWTGYLRARWVEHLQGKCFWVELDRGDFGLLLREFQDCPQLLNVILDRLKSGHENLTLLVWAIWSCDEALPTGRMIDILEALDINSRRLSNQFDPE